MIRRTFATLGVAALLALAPTSAFAGNGADDTGPDDHRGPGCHRHCDDGPNHT